MGQLKKIYEGNNRKNQTILIFKEYKEYDYKPGSTNTKPINLGVCQVEKCSPFSLRAVSHAINYFDPLANE